MHKQEETPAYGGIDDLGQDMVALLAQLATGGDQRTVGAAPGIKSVGVPEPQRAMDNWSSLLPQGRLLAQNSANAGMVAASAPPASPMAPSAQPSDLSVKKKYVVRVGTVTMVDPHPRLPSPAGGEREHGHDRVSDADEVTADQVTADQALDHAVINQHNRL